MNLSTNESSLARTNESRERAQTEIEAESVNVGDLVQLSAGAAIPADGVLVSLDRKRDCFTASGRCARDKLLSLVVRKRLRSAAVLLASCSRMHNHLLLARCLASIFLRVRSSF